jgi:hypothetical protein
MDRDSRALTRGKTVLRDFGRANGAGTTSGLAKREQLLVLAARIALIASARDSAAAEKIRFAEEQPAKNLEAEFLATLLV